MIDQIIVLITKIGTTYHYEDIKLYVLITKIGTSYHYEDIKLYHND